MRWRALRAASLFCLGSICYALLGTDSWYCKGSKTYKRGSIRVLWGSLKALGFRALGFCASGVFFQSFEFGGLSFRCLVTPQFFFRLSFVLMIVRTLAIKQVIEALQLRFWADRRSLLDLIHSYIIIVIIFCYIYVYMYIHIDMLQLVVFILLQRGSIALCTSQRSLTDRFRLPIP